MKVKAESATASVYNSLVLSRELHRQDGGSMPTNSSTMSFKNNGTSKLRPAELIFHQREAFLPLNRLISSTCGSKIVRRLTRVGRGPGSTKGQAMPSPYPRAMPQPCWLARVCLIASDASKYIA